VNRAALTARSFLAARKCPQSLIILQKLSGAVQRDCSLDDPGSLTVSKALRWIGLSRPGCMCDAMTRNQIVKIQGGLEHNLSTATQMARLPDLDQRCIGTLTTVLIEVLQTICRDYFRDHHAVRRGERFLMLVFRIRPEHPSIYILTGPPAVEAILHTTCSSFSFGFASSPFHQCPERHCDRLFDRDRTRVHWHGFFQLG
jgi:hypothetical protein